MSYKISLAGDLGSGKSTVSNLLLEHYKDMEYYSTGAIMRAVAKERGCTIEELNRATEENNELDTLIDNGLIALSDDPRSLIIDSRMAWHFVRGTFRVYLSCDAETSAARIMNARREGESFESFAEACENIKSRRASERKRYSEQYGVDITDMSNYDLVLDTTYISPETVADYLIEAFESFKTNNGFRSCCICPERLFYNSEDVDMDIVNELADKLEQNGLCDEVTVVERAGDFYIDKGTNSALAYAISDYPLVPARLVKKEIPAEREYVKMKTSL